MRDYLLPCCIKVWIARRDAYATLYEGLHDLRSLYGARMGDEHDRRVGKGNICYGFHWCEPPGNKSDCLELTGGFFDKTGSFKSTVRHFAPICEPLYQAKAGITARVNVVQRQGKFANKSVNGSRPHSHFLRICQKRPNGIKKETYNSPDREGGYVILLRRVKSWV